MGSMIFRTKPIRVACNILWCAVLFAPWGVKPRETISGLFGRKALTVGGWFWVAGRNFIDRLHVYEQLHCAEIATSEERMRQALYS